MKCIQAGEYVHWLWALVAWRERNHGKIRSTGISGISTQGLDGFSSNGYCTSSRTAPIMTSRSSTVAPKKHDACGRGMILSSFGKHDHDRVAGRVICLVFQSS
jgi:hypothetical protein